MTDRPDDLVADARRFARGPLREHLAAAQALFARLADALEAARRTMSHAERAEVVARTALARDWECLAHTAAVVELLGPDATDEARAVGWLHDVLEDTDLTDEDLRDMGFPELVIAATLLLTKGKGESYEMYRWRILGFDSAAAAVARLVKLADARDNLSRCERAAGVPKWERLAEKRYRPLIRDLERVAAHGVEVFGFESMHARVMPPLPTPTYQTAELEDLG